MPGDITGRKVLNRYKIIEKIGGGGMSVVWKAYDLVLDRNVALKILRPEMSEDEDFIRRFRREAQSVASLSHPNIVNIYDVGEDRGLYFIVMELIDGETLRDKLKAQGSLEVGEALGLAAEMCEALAHAHARRIIHRDIKPQNILLTKQGHVKVADFGIARALGGISTTSRDVVVGSAPYISPEQAKNGVVSTRSDLYSLGVVIFEMLAGKPPFGGDSPVAVALQHVEAEPPSLREKHPSIPVAVDELIKKAMAKDPDQRFQSAEEMLQAIKRAQASGTADAPAARSKSGDVAGPVGDGDLPRPKKGKREMSTAVKVFLGLAAFGVIAVVVAVMWFNHMMSAQPVQVPDVVGKTEVEAQAALEDAGLVFKISGKRYDATVPAGTVLTQSPEAGDEAKTGRWVYCLLSQGQDFATVPDLSGMDEREVNVALDNAGLLVGKVTTKPSETVEKDHVISQNPRAGLEIAKGKQVDIDISTGPEVPTAKVPPVTGLTVDAAKKALNDALLTAGSITYRASSGADGLVLEQSVAAGAQVPLQSKVDLVVSGKQPPPAPNRNYVKEFTVPTNLTPAGMAVRVRIWVVQDNGVETLVFDLEVPPGVKRSVNFSAPGPEAKIKIEMGGKITYETLKPVS